MALLNKRGFRFAETMSGTYAPVSAPETRRPISFTIENVADSVMQHLRDGKMRLRGTLEMEGFAEEVPIEGTLTMSLVRKRMIRYEFAFTGDDGKPYRFAGQKDIRIGDLRRTMTHLPAEITDASGAVVATAETNFDISSDWLQFASSWRSA